MAYLPLARKYRPQTFADLIGQPHVTATLTKALESKRLAQAYLFAGQRGVGKTSAARILAKCLNCATGPTPAPCQTCPSCAQITQGNSLDVIEIDGASNRGIDEIRSLRETVPFAPTSGQFRVYIIDEVHMLTTEAFNALLKTLEEPPAHVKFIFATTAPTKVPATVLSRCQRFDFRRVEAATIVRLKQVWQREYGTWRQRDLSTSRYVYWRVDGIYFNVRLDTDRQCLLVIIGARPDRTKELLAIDDGFRESADSWRSLLRELKQRGLTQGPAAATGDGALGFWVGLAEEFPQTKPQLCWVHKTANVFGQVAAERAGQGEADAV